MIPAFPPRPTHAEWKTLYRAAILEKNKSVIRQRIFQAERAVLARGRELFYKGGTREERNALDHALHALRALRSACEHTDAA